MLPAQWCCSGLLRLKPQTIKISRFNHPMQLLGDNPITRQKLVLIFIRHGSAFWRSKLWALLSDLPPFHVLALGASPACCPSLGSSTTSIEPSFPSLCPSSGSNWLSARPLKACFFPPSSGLTHSCSYPSAGSPIATTCSCSTPVRSPSGPCHAVSPAWQPRSPS